MSISMNNQLSFETERTPGRISRVSIAFWFFVMYVIGMHLRLSLYAGGTLLLPFYISVFAAIFLFLLYKGDILKQLPLYILIFIFFLIVPLINGAEESFSLSVYRSSIQLIASFVMMHAIVCFFRDINPNKLRRFAIACWILLIGLAILESLFLRSFFDSIAEVIYSGSGRGVYDSLDRDVLLYGSIRPKAFASEPSYLATSLSILSTIYHLTSQRTFNSLAKTLVMFAVSFAVSPSFIILFFLLANILWRFWPKNKNQWMAFVISVGLIFSILLLFASWMASAAELLGALTGDHSSTGSFFGRIAVAHLVGYDSILKYPFLGVGVGNDVAAGVFVNQRWSSEGGFTLFPWYAYLRTTDLMSNGFWWQWIYLGIIGTGFVIFVTYKSLSQFGVEYPMRAIVCAWVVWYAGAAFVDPLSWFIVSLFTLSPSISRIRYS